MNIHCHRSSEYKRIFNRVINWGIIHGKSFNLDKIKEEKRIMMEIEIFGKLIDDFTNNERTGFIDACHVLDYHFNTNLPEEKEHNPNELFPYCFDNEDSSSSKITISLSEDNLNSDVEFIGMKNSKSEPTIKNNFDMMNLNNMLIDE